MPYPGAGYVYTALFFVPRSVLPDKGYASAIEFTAAIVNEPADVSWRFGVGVVEELMLNFGTLAVPLGLAVFGRCLALGSRAARRVPVLRVPFCLAACGRSAMTRRRCSSPFRAMGAVCVALDGLMRAVLVQPLPLDAAATFRGRPSSRPWQSARRLTMARSGPITIGLPFFNCERTLADAMPLGLRADRSDWELLLVDDGSTDGSLRIARQVRDPRVTVISDGVNRGLPSRLNQIAALSVAAPGADGWRRSDAPGRVSIGSGTFLQLNSGVDAVGSRRSSSTRRNEVTGCGGTPVRSVAATVLEHGLFIHPTVMGRRDWFRAHPYDPRFVRAEDRELWCRAAGQTTFARLDDALLFYREPCR